VKVQAETILRQLFEEWSGEKTFTVKPLQASGSPRQYYRLASAATTAVGAFNPDLKENDAFLYLSRHFRSAGLPVPEILAEKREQGIYLLTDLGNRSLFGMITENKNDHSPSGALSEILFSTVRMLPHFQIGGGRGLDYTRCYPAESFDRRSIMWDLNYFKYYILKTSGITFDEQALEKDFEGFASRLEQAGSGHFMYRDFQSRNVMIVDGSPWFIDYQGGRRGPLQYDLASFLYQVKAGFSESLRMALLEAYLDELSKLEAVGREAFMEHFYDFVYLRLFQVLGAYGFRGLFEKRPHFAGSLAPALSLLAGLLRRHPPGTGDEFSACLTKLAGSSSFGRAKHPASPLVVSITSFSYKKGIPADTSGHGGGFVFDCRALPNPGRLEEYSRQTGRDKAVISYMDSFRQADLFLHNVFEICRQAVENYIERGFDHLNISFGCTGGQHRSVYCADRLAEHLREKYVIQINLCHREQGISENMQGTDEQKDL
jgi:aminoglycoside/choline kinase family phosphotransferase